ncbi:uncharacterized protein LOC124493513 [Dermatophagoides farinae]|uniref:uncharacterized protein LOC124493513 n=1 Tax=Dermatophagoides farinae TaxID=6954 RepID=UPI003F5E058A
MTQRFPYYNPTMPMIPEPPRVVPIQPWIQDDSIDMDRNHLTTTIHPCKDTLKQLRLKFGIITDNDNRINPDDSLIENIKLIDLNNDNTTTKSTDNKCCRHNNNDLQNQLNKLQNNLRNQLIELQTSDDDDHEKCPGSTTPKQLLEYIRKQDERLTMINQKIDQLLQLQKSLTIEQQQQQIERSVQTTTTTTIHQKPNHHHLKKTSLSSEESPSLSSSSSMNSSTTQNYLDSSIEKMRKDLYDSVRLKRHHLQQTKVKQFLQSPPSNKLTTNNDDDRVEKVDEFNYTTMLSEVNSILVRNGSVSTSTPMSKPKRHQQRQQQHHPRQLLRTEQSIYIQRLASKYCMDDNVADNQTTKIDNDDDDDEIVLESIRKSTRINTLKMTKHVQPPSPKIDYQKFQTNYNRYALSDHNSSIATRNYMDKYGLYIETTMNKHRKSLNPKHNRYKSSILIEDVDDDDDDDENYLDAKANVSNNTDLQNNRTPAPPPPPDRLIDLDLMKKLPKLK